MKTFAIVGSVTVLVLTGCSGGISGVYKAKGDAAAYESIEFSGGKVSLILGEGKAMQGTFTAEGDTVTVTVPPGATETFTKDKDGCLKADMLGTYCK